MDLKYRTPIKVPCFDTDASFRMKPAAFMDHAQEIAYSAATHFGFGYEALEKHGCAWVLSRMHIRFVKTPLWRDETVLETWHKGSDGLFFHRDFILRDAAGEIAVEATSAWLVIDTRSRRLVKSADVLQMVPWTVACEDHAISEPAPKIIMPREGREDVGVHRVAYSDLDIIGHTNNARYMVWSMDALDFEDVCSRAVREVWINFNHETKPGDAVALSRVRVVSEDNSLDYFIEGAVDNRNAFIARIQL